MSKSEVAKPSKATVPVCQLYAETRELRKLAIPRCYTWDVKRTPPEKYLQALVVFSHHPACLLEGLASATHEVSFVEQWVTIWIETAQHKCQWQNQLKTAEKSPKGTIRH